MRILLLAGLGPSWPQGSAFYNSNMLASTFLDGECYHTGLKRNLKKDDFYIKLRDGGTKKLFRYRNGIEKNLSSLTLESILEQCKCDYEFVDLERVWQNEAIKFDKEFDYIFLSTTFICNMHDINYAIEWCKSNFASVSIVLGGQYSNLKFYRIMSAFPDVEYIMRGDGEVAIPTFLEYKNSVDKKIEDVYNLVYRLNGKTVVNELKLFNVNEIPPIKVNENTSVMYYESMRGCAFKCKFCSFPAASPVWRYKSAKKIAEDWKFYADNYGVKRICAMDSAFTFPPKRLQELMEFLSEENIEWEAYSRADVINSPEIIADLEKSKCRVLSIGFESLSDNTLKYMNKRITADQNRKANELLNTHADKLNFRASFIVGFPGETEEDFMKTHDFLVNDYKKQFHLSVFSLVDETMPIWNDADKYDLVVGDLENPDYYWSHCGMDVHKARELHQKTLYDVRWKNEFAVATEWQLPYDLPLNSDLDFTKNYRIEKLIERIAFVDKDFAGDEDKIRSITETSVKELESLGVFIEEQ